MMTRITVDGFDGRVGFHSRYCGVNTYCLESASVLGVQVRIKDDGSFYFPDKVYPWPRESVRAAIIEYEKRCHAAYVQWAHDKGYPVDHAPHAIVA